MTTSPTTRSRLTLPRPLAASAAEAGRHAAEAHIDRNVPQHLGQDLYRIAQQALERLAAPTGQRLDDYQGFAFIRAFINAYVQTFEKSRREPESFLRWYFATLPTGPVDEIAAQYRAHLRARGIELANG